MINYAPIMYDTRHKSQGLCLYMSGETVWLTMHNAVNQTCLSIYSQKVCRKVVSYIVFSGESRHQKTG